MKQAGLNQSAKVGINECTTETQFFNVTSIIKTLPSKYKEVFLVDQPGEASKKIRIYKILGIGGLKITEAGYLAKFGPGHFNYTLLLGEKGFNDLDMKLLNHLLYNKKPVSFVRTQCDKNILALQDDNEVSKLNHFSHQKLKVFTSSSGT